jgi:formylglycine-generating enzyme required for sulfatase activity/putative cell wall-binding protein
MVNRRVGVAVLAVLALVGTLVVPAVGQESCAVARVAGDTRVETAVAVSERGWDSADTVVVARGDEYADALAGAPLAAAQEAPVLLVHRDELPAATEAEIDRLGADRVIVLGGQEAVSEEVAAALRAKLLSVERIGGADRFETAALVAAELEPTGTAFLVEGVHADAQRGWPDAVSAAPYAAFAGHPVLLTVQDVLPEATADALGDRQVGETIVVGGSAAVSDEVVAEVEAAGHGPRRLFGADRYATSTAVLAEAVEAGMTPEVTWLATGGNWPDALTAGPAVAADGDVLVLIDGADLDASPASRDALVEHAGEVRLANLLGGTGAIAAGVEGQVRDVLACQQLPTEPGPEIELGPRYTNSLGMDLVEIEPGTYTRGSTEGFFDELPVHEVTITEGFHMAATPVTNAQYEAFDPDHAELRGKLGWSTGDDEAVVFVSWHDAVAFTEWLSEEEGLPYRLATEAEWEYAARAGTTTDYWTGEELPEEHHRNQNNSWFPGRDSGHEYVDLTVGQTPANPWGLHDVHGLVEEWVHDWYGPYDADPQTDPVGRADGNFRLARGGSHSTTVDYLRSAQRMATLPEVRNWITGFRVVIGELPDTDPQPVPDPELVFSDVNQETPADVAEGPDPDQPYFQGPRWYINLEPSELGEGRFGNHNHQPAVTEAPNGDLIAIWYTTWVDANIGAGEADRQLMQAGARLRHGADEWEDASIFWGAPARNDHGNDIWWDGEDTLYHWTGLGAAGTWGALALVQRTSTDNGATWSEPRLIVGEQGLRNQVIAAGVGLSGGRILLPADATTRGSGGTAVHISADRGQTWTDPGVPGELPISEADHEEAQPSFDDGETGEWIAGIHAPVVELSDGRLMALGRGNNIDSLIHDEVDGRMPMSISEDGGETWTYTASEFDPIGGGQRAMLLNLEEGAIMFASFTRGMVIQDELGLPRMVRGLYTAVSFDDGETWPHKRLVTDDGPPREMDEGAMRGEFTMSQFTSENYGYLSATQSRDGLIHLISSGNHYTFNLAWLTSPPPSTPQ